MSEKDQSTFSCQRNLRNVNNHLMSNATDCITVTQPIKSQKSTRCWENMKSFLIFLIFECTLCNAHFSDSFAVWVHFSPENRPLIGLSLSINLDRTKNLHQHRCPPDTFNSGALKMELQTLSVSSAKEESYIPCGGWFCTDGGSGGDSF